jgi:hypothetical protein
VKSLILGQRALKPSNIASYRDITEKKEQEMSYLVPMHHQKNPKTQTKNRSYNAGEHIIPEP